MVVDFKVDRTAGKTWLMEVNGRFWGSLPLAIAEDADLAREELRLSRPHASEDGVAHVRRRLLRIANVETTAWMRRMRIIVERRRVFDASSRIPTGEP